MRHSSFVIPAFVMLCVALLFPARVSAHANLVSSNPAANAILAAAPAVVTLTFSEPLEAVSHATITDSEGTVMDRGDSRIAPQNRYQLLVSLPALADGVYTVQWSSLSASDGHSSRGAFAFAIGDPAALNAPLLLPPALPNPLGLPPLESTLLRWLSVLALTLAGGALAFAALVAPVVAWPDQAAQRWNRWQRGVLAVALVAGALLALLSVWQLARSSQVSISQVLNGRGAALLILRAALFGTTGAAVYWSAGKPRQLWLPLSMWSITALTVSLLGHSAVVDAARGGTLLMVVSLALDWLHLAATAVWIGGLLALAGSYWAMRPAPADERLHTLSFLVPRFSGVALGSVGVITVTGLWSAWRHIGSLEQMWTTTYGRSLLVKLVLFGILLLLGAINRQKLVPQIDQDEPNPRALRLLRRSIRVELALGVVVLALVGSLTSAPPARAVQTSPGYAAFARQSGVGIALQMLPASNGQYVIAVTTDGLSATPPPRVLIRTQMATHHMPEEQFELERVAPDRWGTRGAFLSMVGAWDYEVIVRTPGRDDLRHTFSVDTLVVDSASTAPVSLWQRLSLPPTMIAAFAVIGLALLTAAGGSWVANGVPRGVWRRGAIGLVFCSFLLCTVPYYVAIAMTPRNPYDATPEILAAGKATYQKNCLPCHGVAGQGNGPQARGLPVQPANFTLPHYATHPEALLFGWVKNGINGRGMPAFKAALSDKEIWQVMTYISDLNLQANAGDPSKDTPTGP